MLSLRAFARAAPLRASRIASSTSAASFRPAIQHAYARTPAIALQTPRIATFSTTRSRFDEHSQALAAKLESEISIETDESTSSAGSDTNVDSFLAEYPDWSIADTTGKQDVFLHRKFDDEDITVHFSIADFDNQMMDDGEDGDIDSAMGDEEDMDLQSGGANTKGSINQGGSANKNFRTAPEDSLAPADREELSDEDDEAGPAFPVNVNVLIQRPSKGALKFSLLASDGDFMIQQLVQLPSDSSNDAHTLLRDISQDLYVGPPFQQLDEEVQGLLEQYLSARGVTAHLATFIPDYIDVKEQKEYLGWLGRVKEFVE